MIKSPNIKFLYAALTGMTVWITGVALTVFSGWGLVMVNVGKKTFGDLRIITSTSGCITNPTALDFFGESCTVWATNPDAFPSLPYNYPKLWALLLAKIGIVEVHTNILGLIFITLYAVAVSLLVHVAIDGIKYRFATAALILFVSLSPGALLGMERGNFDLLVFFCFAVGIAFGAVNKNWIAALFLSIASIMKIFPIGSLFYFLARKDKKIQFFAASLILTVAGMFFYLSDFKQIGERTPLDTASSFGVAVLPLHALNVLQIVGQPPQISRIFGLVAFVVVIAIFSFIAKSSWGNPFGKVLNDFALEISKNSISQLLFLTSVGALGTAYVFGTNYEYRIIFMIPLIAAIARVSQKSIPFALWMLSCLLVVTVSTNRTDGYQFVGDLLLAILIPMLILIMYKVINLTRGKTNRI